MLRKIGIFLGLALGGLWAQNVGDTLWVHLNDFRSLVLRQDTLWAAEVAAVGDHIVVAKIPYREFVNPLTGADTVYLTTDSTDLDALASDLVNEFENTIRPGLFNTFNITQDELEDPDANGKILVVLAPLWTVNNADGNTMGAPGLVPITGYFDATDITEDSVDMIVLNVDDELLTNSSWELNPASTFGCRLAYFFSRYALWSIDPYEAPGANTALAAYMAYSLYPEMLRGFKEGNQFGNFKGNFQYVNKPLYGYTTIYYNSPVARDEDRERGLIWLLYVAERFGEDFVVSLVHDTLYTVEQAIKNEIYSQGSTVSDEVADFWLRVVLHGHSGGQYDFAGVPPESTFVATRTDIPTVNRGTVGFYPYSAFYGKTLSLVDFLTFNGKDGCKVVIGGDTFPGFKPFKLYFDSDFNLTRLEEITPDSLNHFVITDLNPETGEKTAILIVNISEGAYEMSWASDTTPPQVDAILAIQNPVYTKSVDIYMFTPPTDAEQIYTDAGTADTFPIVACIPEDQNYNTEYVTLSVLAMSDSGDVYWNYYGYGNLEITDDFGNIYSGTVTITPYRPMDQVGNIQTSVPSTQVSVLPLSSQGGSFRLVGGVLMDVPRGAVPEGTFLMASVLDHPELYLGRETPGKVYSIGSPSVLLLDPIKLSFPAFEGASLYRWSGEAWEPVEAWLSQDGSRLVAWVDALGIFMVGQDEGQLPSRLVVRAPTLFRSGVGTLYLELPEDQRVTYEVYSLDGRRLLREDLGVVPAGKRYINMHLGSASGLYVYRLHVGDLTITRKALSAR